MLAHRKCPRGSWLSPLPALNIRLGDPSAMIRTFQQHTIRPVASLGGRWDFTTAEDRSDRAKLPKTYARKALVPSAWETMPGLEAYRGQAWYRTRFFADSAYAARLVFGGVSHTGVAYVDGREVGRHYDAFTPWEVVAPSLKTGEHELVVAVDNSFGAHSALHIENDYYTYGGITRPAELQYVPEVYVSRLFATPLLRAGKWSLEVKVRLANWSDETLRRRVCVSVDAAHAFEDLGLVSVRPGQVREVRAELKDLAVEAWTAETPVLYDVQVDLVDDGEVVDDLVDRIGFREVRVQGRKLLLNGKPLRLRGYNRHEDHPLFGNALPLEAMVADLEIMRDLGCNFVRTCHYPNDLRFLDLCDEMGFYVWEESHARTVDFSHPRYREQITDSTNEMLEWHYNRPSIVMWGCLNECASHTASGKKEHAHVLKLLKKGDPSRPITFASNHHTEDLCLGLVDIVSWNRYDAWYSGEPEDIAPHLEEMLEWLHSPKSKGGNGKPVIMSEFGAGGIYGCRQACRAKWSEEYQDEVLDESLRVYLNHKDVVGAAIWQFCDVRITRGWWKQRPRTMNNKGTVDEYRRPKMCYETVKRRMEEAREKWDKR